MTKIKELKYKVIYLTGSGREIDEGIWEVKRTPKTITTQKIEEGNSIFENYDVGTKMKIGKGTGNPIKDEEEDGEFTCYFQQAGTPYIFNPIKNYENI